MRDGRRYLYRNRRVNGRPVKEYLAADDQFGFGALMADELAQALQRNGDERERARAAGATLRARVDEVLANTANANAELQVLAEGVLCALGFHKHKRGAWRMRRQLHELRDTLASLKERVEKRNPVIEYRAPNSDAEAVELFAKARTGDVDAKARVVVLIRERKWADWFGDLGRQATCQLIRQAAGNDPVWEAGITEKAVSLRTRLLGDNPTVLEELLVRRVVNGWLATHALELELTVRPPTRPRDREYMDRALTRAQKRFTDAARELARVRQLKAPAILAQLNLAAAQTVVNAVPITGAARSSGSNQ